MIPLKLKFVTHRAQPQKRPTAYAIGRFLFLFYQPMLPRTIPSEVFAYAAIGLRSCSFAFLILGVTGWPVRLFVHASRAKYGVQIIIRFILFSRDVGA